MQTSNHSSALSNEFEPEHKQVNPSTAHQNFFFSIFILLIFAITSIWVMQNSINAYYQQTYHQNSPLLVLNELSLWRVGGDIGDYLYQQRDTVESTIANQNNSTVENYNQNYAFSAEYLAQKQEKIQQEKLALQKRIEEQAQSVKVVTTTTEVQPSNHLPFVLTQEDQVFFAGDSLMQGVAPHVQKTLNQEFGIKTVNLSKQSTGLAYPNFFNWPKTIKETISSNPHIKILVVFLGPNDPWDMQNPKGGSYLKFGSHEWEEVYRSRIKDIIQTAQQHNIEVMWLTPPNMRKPKLNEQMIYLNHLIEDEVKQNHAYVIDTRPILGGHQDHFSETAKIEEKNIKMRSADGIHFSVEGQKAIAKEIMQRFNMI